MWTTDSDCMRRPMPTEAAQDMGHITCKCMPSENPLKHLATNAPAAGRESRRPSLPRATEARHRGRSAAHTAPIRLAHRSLLPRRQQTAAVGVCAGQRAEVCGFGGPRHARWQLHARSYGRQQRPLVVQLSISTVQRGCMMRLRLAGRTCGRVQKGGRPAEVWPLPRRHMSSPRDSREILPAGKQAASPTKPGCAPGRPQRALELLLASRSPQSALAARAQAAASCRHQLVFTSPRLLLRQPGRRRTLAAAAG